MTAAHGAGDLPARLLELLACPVCRAAVAPAGAGLRCVGCARRYPVVMGIPDLRVHEDPLIPLEEDYRKAERLLAEASRRTYLELVEYYWSLPTVPPTPARLARRFVHHVLTDGARVATYRERLGRGGALLDVGCGAGALLQAVHGQFPLIVGCDVGLRWLVVARHGLEQAGVPGWVVCGCAEHLPFATGSFQTVASVGLLEHLDSPPDALGEFRRVAIPGGRVFAWTTNRYSLAPEPHVGLFGVGYLPRRWQPAYVRWRTGLAYHRKRLVGRLALSRALRGAGLHRPRYALPAITPGDFAHRSLLERGAGHLVRCLGRVPGVRALLTWVAPALQVVADVPGPDGLSRARR